MAANQREAQRREAEDFRDLKSMASKAFRGVYGEIAREVALSWSRDYVIRFDQIEGLHFQHKPALEALRALLRAVPDRQSG